MGSPLDPFDRFTRRPLEDVLLAHDAVPRERLEPLVPAAKSGGVPLAALIVEAGLLTAWDLARVIATHYQMPVQPLTGYRFERGLFEGVKAAVLHRHLVVPIGRFGATRTFAVVEPPSRELLEELIPTYGPSLFFFVSEVNEVSLALQEHVKVVDTISDTTWQTLFDSADQEVSKTLGSRSS